MLLRLLLFSFMITFLYRCQLKCSVLMHDGMETLSLTLVTQLSSVFPIRCPRRSSWDCTISGVRNVNLHRGKKFLHTEPDLATVRPAPLVTHGMHGCCRCLGSYQARGHVHMMSAGRGTPPLPRDAVRKLSKGGWVKMQIGGGRSKESKNFADIICIWPQGLARSKGR